MERPKPLGHSGICSHCRTDLDYSEAMESYADHLEALVKARGQEGLNKFQKWWPLFGIAAYAVLAFVDYRIAIGVALVMLAGNLRRSE